MILSSRRLGFVDSPKERVQFHSSELSGSLGLNEYINQPLEVCKTANIISPVAPGSRSRTRSYYLLKDCNFRLRVKEGREVTAMLMNGLRSFHPNKTPLEVHLWHLGSVRLRRLVALSTITNLLKFVTAILAPGHCSISPYHMLHPMPPQPHPYLASSHPLAPLLITTMKCQRKKE